MYGGLIERSFDAPVIAQPFRDFEAESPLYQHWRFVRLQVVEFGSFLSPDFEGSGANSQHEQTFLLWRAEFRPEAPRSRLQVQFDLERREVAV